MENITPSQQATTLQQPNQTPQKNDLSIFFNPEQFTIIKRYRKIHRFLFKHGAFALMMVIALVLNFQLLQANTDEIMTQNNSSLLEFAQRNWERQMRQNANTEVEILTLYGESTTTDEYHSSVSNLASYQGIIVPRIFQIENGVSLLDIQQFEEKKVSSAKLIQTIEQLIFASSVRNTTISENLVIPLKNGIIEDFNLQCVMENKVSNIICDRFLDLFYQNGIFYNLDNYANELTDIMNALKDKEAICQMMYDTTLYQRKTLPIFDTLILQCPIEQAQKYRDLSNFIEVERELES